MPKTAIFTIASQNYISYARTLLESVIALHPEVDSYLLLVDEPNGQLDLSKEKFAVLLAKDIGIGSFQEMSFKYDIMELNTAVKPFFMKYLLQKGYNNVIYFDPDIMLFNRMDVILQSLENHSIVITPHITNPIPYADKHVPGERDFLSSGTYNLGFIAVSDSDESHDFLDWWSERCEHECYSEIETGFFVDQKWINLVPGLYSSVKILRDPGCNMAYWNLHERYLQEGKVNGEYPLVFYHFSGIDPSREGQLSKYQDRFTLEERTDIKGIFSLYRNRILSNGYHDTVGLPYAYACYDNGAVIGPFARRMYVTAAIVSNSPFNTGPGTYYDMLKDRHLLGTASAPKYTKDNTSTMRDKLNWMFILFARVVGIDKYYAFMKYLRHVSVTRRQSFLFEKKSS